jgi:hypothetical protein
LKTLRRESTTAPQQGFTTTCSVGVVFSTVRPADQFTLILIAASAGCCALATPPKTTRQPIRKIIFTRNTAFSAKRFLLVRNWFTVGNAIRWTATHAEISNVLRAHLSRLRHDHGGTRAELSHAARSNA